jgi:hypothetical protein
LLIFAFKHPENMRKNLLVFILIFFTILLQAQIVLFSEDFNLGSIPSNFTTYDLDGLTPSSAVTNYCPFTGSFVVCQFGGDTFAASSSSFTSAGTANDWMSTPSIALGSNNNSKFLLFDTRSGDPSYLDGVEIYVSTTGNTPQDFLTSTALYNSTGIGEPVSWTTRSVDLSAYSGQTIYIGFRNNTYDKLVLGIDNIKVLELSDNNAELSSLNFPQYTTIPALFDIEGTITNVGGNTINSMDITWTDGTNSYTDNLTGLNIPFNDLYNFTHNTQLNLVNSGSQNITVTIDNINANIDPDTSNNSLTTIINTVPFVPTKRVLFEESGGTWCPFCPQGIVAMESIEQQFPLTAIPIAVHNADMMTNNLYDQNINVTNWPSVRIDRAILGSGTQSTTAESFLQYYSDRINIFSPVEINANAVFDAETRNISIDLSGQFAINLTGDYRFNAIILENEVGPYNQQNNYVGIQPQLIAPISGVNFSSGGNPINIKFDNVAREILGGYDGIAGSLPNTITEGATYTYQYTHTLASNYNENNIKVVGIIIEHNTGEILNAIKVDVAILTEPLVTNLPENQNLIIYPSPTKNEILIKGEFETLKIYNILGKMVLKSNKKRSINVSQLNNGIYTVKIKNKTTIISKNFIIAR